MTKKGLWWFALVFVMGVALLSGCGSTEKDGAGSEAGGQVDNSSIPAPGPTELVFYSLGNAPEESFNQLYGEAILKKFPQFTLKYIPRGSAAIDAYVTNLLTSGAVDINFDSIGNIPAGMLKFQMEFDMTELIKKYHLDLSRYEPSAIDGMKTLSGGKMYGLPVFNTNRLLFYNKDLFDKFGVPYPKDGMSWDDAIALGKRMTRADGGVQYFGLSSSKEHQIRMNALSVPLVDAKTGKATINTDERWKSIFTKGFYEPYNDPGYRQAIKALPSRNEFYKTKNLAMMVYLSFLPANEPDPMSQVNWDMVSEPYYKELPNVSSQVYPTYFSVVSTSKHKDEAMQAIQVLMSPEHQTFLSRQGQMPVLNDAQIKQALGQDTPFKDKNWQSVFHNKFAPIPYKSMYDIDVEKIYLAQVVNYAKGTVDLNTLFRTAEEAANKYLEENK